MSLVYLQQKNNEITVQLKQKFFKDVFKFYRLCRDGITVCSHHCLKQVVQIYVCLFRLLGYVNVICLDPGL